MYVYMIIIIFWVKILFVYFCSLAFGIRILVNISTMDGIDRNVRTTVEQWKVIVEYLEQNPSMVKNKFENYDGDSKELKKKWDDLAKFLNSMGFGSRSVEKWQLAIARWKSKTKAKAAAVKFERQKTGGGPSKTPQLNPIEERLMCLLGWKSVTGDENMEIGLKLPCAEGKEKTPTQNEISEVFRDPNRSKSPPPLIPINEPQNTVSPMKAQKRKAVRTTTEKTKRFVTMNRMHTEHMAKLSKIEGDISDMSRALVSISQDFKSLVDNVAGK